MIKVYRSALFSFLAFFFFALSAQKVDHFKQLNDEWPTPNQYRTAAGAPGHHYYQQRADYLIDVTLDENNRTITGVETITYFNQSPDALEYLWLQLDQNIRKPGNDADKIKTQSLSPKMSFEQLNALLETFEGGYHIEYVKDIKGANMPITIVNTMMRIDLAAPLKPGAQIQIKIKWWFNVQDRAKFGGRMGLEYFAKDSNYLYTISKFFPRMCVYNDVYGWQNKQFLGRGEFSLPFGNYRVKITVPADHIVAATGTLQNEALVLSSTQRKRLEEAKKSDKPILIVTEAEARETETKRAKGTKTWEFYAENVRDFAFASSRKFIWDAQGVKFGNRTVLAMSYYPKEGNPLWEKYSTKVVAHTLKVYSKHTFDYPYPVAISVHTKDIGMEYPMICFNGGRPEEDGTYSEATKYGMISVIIHEVGHNYFPMIVNSDERQWSWMDEGLNTFLQYLTEQAWDKNYPSRRGPAYQIVDYMKSDPKTLEPIMTNSESIIQFGNNAYGKPATALNILRETIMGRELFDFAFKTYAQRWMFKHPEPTDFFRTMEDASAIDLDWFWRGWFYSTDYCDLALKEVKEYTISSLNPSTEKLKTHQEKYQNREIFIGDIRNRADSTPTVVELDPETRDFYTNDERFLENERDKKEYQELIKILSPQEKSLLDTNLVFYEISIQKIGALVMPIILGFSFEDGSYTREYIPAEIWRFGDETVKKVFVFNQKVTQIKLDPHLETADIDLNNNNWPLVNQPSRIELYKQRRDSRPQNPMQRQSR